MEKIKQTKRLEDYSPGATRSEVMDSLRKTLVKPSCESTMAGVNKSNAKEENDNGKTD